MNNYYKVRELSKLSWVSIKTLHYYDEIGLLKPSTRSKSMYRYYTENELYKLQQIIFYKELDFSLDEISRILNNPEFNILASLENQRNLINEKKNNYEKLLKTIDNTILQIKWETMKDHKKLYDWLSMKYRDEAIKKFWKKQVLDSEKALSSISKADFEKLKSDFVQCRNSLYSLKDFDPHSDEVQKAIENHHNLISRFWWNKLTKDAYKWLWQLYIDDDRYMMDWKQDKDYARFLKSAIDYFADTNLQ